MTIKELKKTRTSRQKLVARLDKLLHDIVVLRDRKCVTCGSTSNLQAGHLLTRSYGRVKYSLVNTHCQCRSCNYLHEYKPDIYTKWFLDKYGKTAYDDLYTEAHLPAEPIKTWHLEAIEETFKVIKKSLENENHWVELEAKEREDHVE